MLAYLDDDGKQRILLADFGSPATSTTSAD
jgi:hypothetical protein